MGNGGYCATYFVNCTAHFSIVSPVKLKKLWWAEYVFWVRETRNKFRILQWKSSGRYLFGRCRRRLENNIQLNFWEVNYEYMNWIELNWTDSALCWLALVLSVLTTNFTYMSCLYLMRDYTFTTNLASGMLFKMLRNPMLSTWQTTTEHSLLLAVHHYFLLVHNRLKLR